MGQSGRVSCGSRPALDETAIVINVMEAAAAFEPLITSGQIRRLNDPGAVINSRAARSIRAVDYVKADAGAPVHAERAREAVRDGGRHRLADRTDSGTKLEQKLDAAFAYSDPLGSSSNLAGLPALSFPCGFSKSGLPVRMQIVGPP